MIETQHDAMPLTREQAYLLAEEIRQAGDGFDVAVQPVLLTRGTYDLLLRWPCCPELHSEGLLIRSRWMWLQFLAIHRAIAKKQLDL
jgi:hypothetical protein